MVRSVDDSDMRVAGGSSVNNGGSIFLFGSTNTSSMAGAFRIRAAKGDAVPALDGKPDGTLTWNNKNIVRSINSVFADTAGNVVLNFLPLAGGTMTGNIIGNREEFTLLKKDDAGSSIIRGGTAYESGASLLLFGKGHENAGIARIVAHDGTNVCNLVMYPDGRITWEGKNVMRSSNAQEIKVVDALPASPDANTLYFVVDEGA